MNFTRKAIWDGPGLMIEAHSWRSVSPARTGKLLVVSDINPEKRITYNVSRWELARIGLWLIRAALRR